MPKSHKDRTQLLIRAGSTLTSHGPASIGRSLTGLPAGSPAKVPVASVRIVYKYSGRVNFIPDRWQRAARSPPWRILPLTGNQSTDRPLPLTCPHSRQQRMTQTPPDRSHIATERRNPRTMNLHQLSIEACVERLSTEDRHAFDAVKRARGRITRFIEAVEPHFLEGGRLIYVGAGTSGRLGVLDASEAPPTFQLPPGRIVGLIAGGDASLRTSSEGKEDDFEGAWAELESLRLTQRDTLLAIAAGGTTPFALGALAFAKRNPAPALTGLLCCATIEPPPHCDHLIMLRTGPEALTGSTRLKAGTATKLVLNIISTTLMIREGRVYENLMVDLRATNDKLTDRAARIISTITGLDREASFETLKNAQGEVKTAVVMQLLNLSAADARARIARANGRLGDVLPSHDYEAGGSVTITPRKRPSDADQEDAESDE